MLGCNYEACQNSRSLGVGKTVVQHKQERTANLFHCYGIFCSPSKRYLCSAVGGQYCCCKLSESCRGDKVPSFGNCNLGMVFTGKDVSSAIHIPGIVNKAPDGLSCQKRFSSDSSCVSAASSGSLLLTKTINFEIIFPGSQIQMLQEQ